MLYYNTCHIIYYANKGDEIITATWGFRVGFKRDFQAKSLIGSKGPKEYLRYNSCVKKTHWFECTGTFAAHPGDRWPPCIESGLVGE